MSDRCDADAYEPHVCDDPAGCAVDRLIRGDDTIEGDLARLHALLDRIEEACAGSRAAAARAVLKIIHSERGGPKK